MTVSCEILPLCLHCRLHHRKIDPYYRGLCWRCWRARGVRHNYAPASPDCVPQVDFCGGYNLDNAPATALSRADRIAVYTDRAARGVAMFHPGDAAQLYGTQEEKSLLSTERSAS